METPIIKKIIFKKSKTHGHQLMSNFPLMRDVKNNIYDLSIQPSLTRSTQVTQGQPMKASDCNHKKRLHIILFLSSQEYKLHPLFLPFPNSQLDHFSFTTQKKKIHFAILSFTNCRSFSSPLNTKNKAFSSPSSSRHPSLLKAKQIPAFAFFFSIRFFFTLPPTLFFLV